MLDKAITLLFSFLIIILVASCGEDDGPSDEEIINTYKLTTDDYVWISKTDLGSKEQLKSLNELKGFNLESGVSRWSTSEVEKSINALLYVKYSAQEGEKYEIEYNVFEVTLNELSIALTIEESKVTVCANVACEEDVILPIEPDYILAEPDYLNIAGMNKGKILQIENLSAFKTFNTDPDHPGHWSANEIEYAINALLFVSYNESIGDKKRVKYDVYNGSEVVSEESEITVAFSEPFDVYTYDALQPSKSNSTKAYVHYMPWFESKEFNGYWGSHWTMANRNPDIFTGDKRQIASHYYPLIGPYSSADPDLVEYHLLLMKLTGLDGVLIDWYGTYDVNDYAQNLENSQALIKKTAEVGLDFGIVYEDRTTENVVNAGKAVTPVEAAINDFRFIKENYFSASNYVKINNENLLLTFTPVFIQNGTDWQQILSESGVDPLFLSIWGESSDLGVTADGEFSWVFNGNANHMGRLSDFYQIELPNLNFGLGSAYPGFKDYYKQGGWGDGIGWEIPHNNVNTLSETLSLTAQNGIGYVQLVTWNDFGEGTMIEPTVEFGYSPLETVQDFVGVDYSSSELEIIYDLYNMRKNKATDQVAQLKLDQVYYYVISLQIDRARQLLASI